jgi:adhesin transport system membrane fusion protein
MTTPPNRNTPALATDERRFVTDLQAAMLDEATPRSRLMLVIFGVVLVSAVAWAWLAQVEEITRAEAVVISQSREQVLKSLDGGVVQRLHVREGDVVERGQLLVNIDATRAEASYRETLMQERALHASVLRLRSEAYGTELDLQPLMAHSPELAAEQRAAYDARRQALQDSLKTLQRSLTLAQQEIELTAPLVAKGLMSQVELLRMRRQENELSTQIVERRDRYRHEAATELAMLEREWLQVRESLPGRADVRDRTSLTAPLRGTVKNIRVHTLGAVVQPGEAILEIVPLDERLLLEGRIKPADIAFLRPGLPAMAKLSAYDFNIYGGLPGVVQHISADALEDETSKATGQGPATYYRVHVLTDTAQLQAPGGPLPIVPGMVATIDIRTGQKSLLDYLLKPVLKAREAFRER